MLIAYHAYVTSTIKYGLIFWGNSTNKDDAFKAQKKCVRAMCGLRPIDSCKDHFRNLAILTLPSQYILDVAMHVKSKPDIYTTLKNRRSNYRTQVVQTKARTELKNKNLTVMAARIYNKLPASIRQIDDINKFKKTLTKILINKTYYDIKSFLNDLELE